MLLFIYIGFLRDDTNALTSKHHFAASRSKMSGLQSTFAAMITKEQIEWGELASLLIEEDYNLSTMVPINLFT